MTRDFLALFIPLLIIMDPVGNLPMFLALTGGLGRGGQLRVAAVACATAAAILLLFGFTGDAILRFFGITLPAFQLAGGGIFFIYALQLLNLIPANIRSSAREEEESLHKDHVALVPLATPLLAGPGAITAVLIWQQGAARPLPPGLLTAVVVAACAAVFVAFALAPWIRRLLGLGGIGVVTRLTGLLLAVIAMQYVVDGLAALP